jgi:hypothetical protein
MSRSATLVNDTVTIMATSNKPDDKKNQPKPVQAVASLQQGQQPPPKLANPKATVTPRSIKLSQNADQKEDEEGANDGS